MADVVRLNGSTLVPVEVSAAAPRTGGSQIPLVTVPAGAAASAPAHLVNPSLSSSGAVQVLARHAQGANAAGITGSGSRHSNSTTGHNAPGRLHARGHRASGGGGEAAAPPPGSGLMLPLAMPVPTQIEHFVSVIPGVIWVALACSLVLAGVAGGAAVRSTRRARRQAGEYAAVAAVALSDPLTGVLNRRGFVQAVERELARANRHETPFVLAYVDVRGLKAVNDSEGHRAGDDVLKRVAGLLTDSVRAEDAVGRLGGDEFALLLAGPSAQGAGTVVRRIRWAVPAYREALGFSTPWGLTIGAAVYPIDGDTFDELLGTADRDLYAQRGIQLR